MTAYSVLPCGWVAVDIDTFAMDNGGTAKDGVRRTYAGMDGFCPLAPYIGAYGWPLALSLRPGTQHSAKDTEDNRKCLIPMARRRSAEGPKAPLLARLDSGFDSAALMACVESMNQPGQRQPSGQMDVLIKWNPRSMDRDRMAAQLDVGQITGTRTGTGTGTGSRTRTRTVTGNGTGTGTRTGTRTGSPGAVTWTQSRAGKRVAMWGGAGRVQRQPASRASRPAPGGAHHQRRWPAPDRPGGRTRWLDDNAAPQRQCAAHH